eukprot:827909_1
MTKKLADFDTFLKCSTMSEDDTFILPNGVEATQATETKMPEYTGFMTGSSKKIVIDSEQLAKAESTLFGNSEVKLCSTTAPALNVPKASLPHKKTSFGLRKKFKPPRPAPTKASPPTSGNVVKEVNAHKSTNKSPNDENVPRIANSYNQSPQNVCPPKPNPKLGPMNTSAPLTVAGNSDLGPNTQISTNVNQSTRVPVCSSVSRPNSISRVPGRSQFPTPQNCSNSSIPAKTSRPATSSGMNHVMSNGPHIASTSTGLPKTISSGQQVSGTNCHSVSTHGGQPPVTSPAPIVNRSVPTIPQRNVSKTSSAPRNFSSCGSSTTFSRTQGKMSFSNSERPAVQQTLQFPGLSDRVKAVQQSRSFVNPRQKSSKFPQKSSRNATKTGGSKTEASNSVKDIGYFQLSESQKQIVDVIKSGKNVFVTGCAGTGKSVLIRHLANTLPKSGTHITAATGLAAMLLSGTTVHSWAGIGLGKAGCLTLVRKIMGKRNLRQRWVLAKILIIDEVSMISGALFDLLEEIARRVRKRQIPFGGIQLVLCGDFLQLPPVKANKMTFEAKSWGRCISPSSMFELTEVFRQRDSDFVSMLSKVRRGVLTDEIRRAFEETATNELSENTTQLFSHRRTVERLNMAELAKLPGQSLVFDAQDSSKFPLNPEELGKMLQQCRAPKRLQLKVGAQVILVKTIDSELGLVNGLRGTVIGFESRTEHQIKKYPGIDTSTQRPGEEKLPVVKFTRPGATREPLTVLIERDSWEIMDGDGRPKASREQLPIDLAWAMTIHKCQGMTLDEAVMDLKSIWESGQFYVAVSRIRSLAGLKIIGFKPSCVKANLKVIHWMHQHGMLKDVRPHSSVIKASPSVTSGPVQKVTSGLKAAPIFKSRPVNRTSSTHMSGRPNMTTSIPYNQAQFPCANRQNSGGQHGAQTGYGMNRSSGSLSSSRGGTMGYSHSAQTGVQHSFISKTIKSSGGAMSYPSSSTVNRNMKSFGVQPPSGLKRPGDWSSRNQNHPNKRYKTQPVQQQWSGSSRSCTPAKPQLRKAPNGGPASAPIPRYNAPQSTQAPRPLGYGRATPTSGAQRVVGSTFGRQQSRLGSTNSERPASTPSPLSRFPTTSKQSNSIRSFPGSSSRRTTGPLGNPGALAHKNRTPGSLAHQNRTPGALAHQNRTPGALAHQNSTAGMLGHSNSTSGFARQSCYSAPSGKAFGNSNMRAPNNFTPGSLVQTDRTPGGMAQVNSGTPSFRTPSSDGQSSTQTSITTPTVTRRLSFKQADTPSQKSNSTGFQTPVTLNTSVPVVQIRNLSQKPAQTSELQLKNIRSVPTTSFDYSIPTETAVSTPKPEISSQSHAMQPSHSTVPIPKLAYQPGSFKKRRRLTGSRLTRKRVLPSPTLTNLKSPNTNVNAKQQIQTISANQTSSNKSCISGAVTHILTSTSGKSCMPDSTAKLSAKDDESRFWSSQDDALVESIGVMDALVAAQSTTSTTPGLSKTKLDIPQRDPNLNHRSTGGKYSMTEDDAALLAAIDEDVLMCEPPVM